MSNNLKDIFNNKYYMKVNKARNCIFYNMLPKFNEQMKLGTAVDVGCGIGYYSSYLSSLGLNVTGIDARQDNIETACMDLPGLKLM